MSKLEEILLQAAAGRRAEAPQPVAPDYTTFLAALASALQDAARMGAAEALAKAPAPAIMRAPPVRWRFEVRRRDGLIEEIIATPEGAP